MIRDRYRIGRVLGQPGGFGVTYLAFDERLHTRVAIKEYMPRDVAGRATSDGSEVWSSGGHEETFQHGLDQFLREARTLAQFDHPNVVGVSNYFETNGTGCLVMDYYEGRTVTQRLSDEPDGRMAPETASGIIEEVADGLREVHAEGYLHRDIKPSNIYLTQEGRPILIDFGAARAALGEHSQNLSVLVSPGYAPYEQYRMRGDLGPYTDVYSCGATLYRMVTGTVPEPASERIVDDKLEPPRTLNPEVPPELSTVIEEAMAGPSPDGGGPAGAAPGCHVRDQGRAAFNGTGGAVSRTACAGRVTRTKCIDAQRGSAMGHDAVGSPGRCAPRPGRLGGLSVWPRRASPGGNLLFSPFDCGGWG